MQAYADFLHDKTQLGGYHGFHAPDLPASLFDFQRALVEWALRKGRGAIFADCGLGKTPMQLAWADQVARKTNGRILILTPLAVAQQTVHEGEKFGIECARSADGATHGHITVANYERLHHFNAGEFVGMVCDESSILKSFDGARRGEITEFMRKLPYRLLCTATAAPNDYIELGTSSEALGELGHMDMLMRFFKNDTNSIKPGMSRRFERPGAMFSDEGKWRFKGHAEKPFWRFICSWARALRKPSDLGFNDERFVLPPLAVRNHMVTARNLAPGALFSFPAVGLKEQREERRRTIDERCELAAALLMAQPNEPSIAWCHLNDEGDLLESMIPGCVQVSGKDSDEAKEEAFVAFAAGEVKKLITKTKIGAWGLNWQHCAHMTFFPSHSYEQYYQAVRRCLRFGQTREVVVDVIATEGEQEVMKNLQRKAKAADKMFADLVAHMNESQAIDGRLQFNQQERIPAWM